MVESTWNFPSFSQTGSPSRNVQPGGVAFCTDSSQSERRSYAGVTYALTFSNQKVTACVETDPTVTETSTFALKTDDGPVLSFDTYNTILHAYATPDSRKYQAKGGDFEFEIRSFDKASKVITMIGKRSRNTCTLRPLAKPAADYFAGVKSFESSLAVPAAAATIGGKEIELFIDSGIRSITIGAKGASSDSLQTVRYVLTEQRRPLPQGAPPSLPSR